MLIEQAMIFALGFLAALLAVLLFLPAFWARAIRLSVRRIAEQMPLSMAEIAAERDGMRAESAIVHRRLEQERNRAVAAHMNLRGENGHMVVKLADLEEAIEAQRLDAAALEARLAETRASLLSTEATLATVGKDHYDASGLLERANRTVEQLHLEVQRVRDVSDQRRVTIAALETRAAGFQARIDDLESGLQDTERALSQKLNDLQTATRARDEARTEVVRLQGHRAELDARVAAQTDHITRLEDSSGGSGIGGTSPDVARHRAIIAKRDETILAEASRNAQLEAQIKRLTLESAEAEQQLAVRIETLRAEKFDLEGALDAARRERDTAQRELRLARAGVGGLPGGDAPGAEHSDVALLRRSIADVAADVVRLLGDKDGAAELTPANVLQLRRERIGGGRDGGKPAGSEAAGSGQNQALGAKLS